MPTGGVRAERRNVANVHLHVSSNDFFVSLLYSSGRFTGVSDRGSSLFHQLSSLTRNEVRRSTNGEGDAAVNGKQSLLRRASIREWRRLANEMGTQTKRRQRSMSLDADEELSTSSEDTLWALPRSTTCSDTSSTEYNYQLVRSGSKRSSSRFIRSLYKNRHTDQFILNCTESLQNTELHAAIIRQDELAVRHRLQIDGTLVEISSLNADGFTPLDIAILTGNKIIADLLISHRARASLPSADNEVGTETMTDKLQLLYDRACRCIDNVKASLTTTVLLSHGKCPSKRIERILDFYKIRKDLYARMKEVHQSAELPDRLTDVTLTVSSDSSLLVTFRNTVNVSKSPVVRFKVEWSTSKSFNPVVGHEVINDPQATQYEITSLTSGTAYYVRVSAGNIRGFGVPTEVNPSPAIPSSWMDIEGCKSRCDRQKIQLLEELFVNVMNFHNATFNDGWLDATGCKRPVNRWRMSTIHSLFSLSSKFQKTLKRGVYLAALVLDDSGRVLVTSDDHIPTVEVDNEQFSSVSSFNSDYYWLLKATCSWNDVAELRRKLERSCSSGTMQFRYRVLQAITQLQVYGSFRIHIPVNHQAMLQSQSKHYIGCFTRMTHAITNLYKLSALGIEDLGHFHHQPIRDSNGSVLLVAVNRLSSTKLTGKASHAKWIALEKVQRRHLTMTNDCETSAVQMLFSMTDQLTKCHRAKATPMPRGLYLGYLKLHSSIDRICIMTPHFLPNVLPCAKVRDSPHVNREEWEMIRRLSAAERTGDDREVSHVTSPHQRLFCSQLQAACRKLLGDLGIDEHDATSGLRLYDMEVIELSADVSMMLILPDAQNVCAAPGHSADERINQTCSMLPIQVFEINNMYTYNRDVIERYCRLSSILEIDVHLAQQAVRQAFSTDEVNLARQKFDQLSKFQAALDELWRGTRWTMDIITYARDRSTVSGTGGLPLTTLFSSLW